MTDDPLLRQLLDTCLLDGSFRLRSGQIANRYFDKYRFESDPALLAAVAQRMARLLPTDTEVLAGLELGGVPVATALSLQTGLPAVFVRKQAKAYGTARIAEGCAFSGRRVVVIEDVITTGGQVIESVAALRSEGAVIADVVCVLLRAAEVPAAFADAGLTLRPAFRVDLGGSAGAEPMPSRG